MPRLHYETTSNVERPSGMEALFLFAQHGQTPDGLKETQTPDQREVNAKATALLVTVGWEGSLIKYAVHSESEPNLAW